MFKKTRNLNDNERVLRMVLGFILLFVSLWALTDLARTVVIVLATYAVITGVVAYCPATEVLTSGSSRHRRRRR